MISMTHLLALVADHPRQVPHSSLKTCSHHSHSGQLLQATRTFIQCRMKWKKATVRTKGVSMTILDLLLHMPTAPLTRHLANVMNTSDLRQSSRYRSMLSQRLAKHLLPLPHRLLHHRTSRLHHPTPTSRQSLKGYFRLVRTLPHHEFHILCRSNHFDLLHKRQQVSHSSLQTIRPRHLQSPAMRISMLVPGR